MSVGFLDPDEPERRGDENGAERRDPDGLMMPRPGWSSEFESLQALFDLKERAEDGPVDDAAEADLQLRFSSRAPADLVGCLHLPEPDGYSGALLLAAFSARFGIRARYLECLAECLPREGAETPDPESRERLNNFARNAATFLMECSWEDLREGRTAVRRLWDAFTALASNCSGLVEERTRWHIVSLLTDSRLARLGF